MKTLGDATCPLCGRPLTYVVVDHIEEGGRTRPDIPLPGELAMCIRCVALVLCKATVAIHGDLGDRPASHNFPGHAERMRDHAARMQQLGLVNGFDEELNREGLAAVPA